jgi:hypothetical protein
MHAVKGIAGNVARMRDRFCKVARVDREDTRFRFAGEIRYAA